MQSGRKKLCIPAMITLLIFIQDILVKHHMSSFWAASMATQSRALLGDWTLCITTYMVLEHVRKLWTDWLVLSFTTSYFSTINYWPFMINPTMARKWQKAIFQFQLTQIFLPLPTECSGVVGLDRFWLLLGVECYGPSCPGDVPAPRELREGSFLNKNRSSPVLISQFVSYILELSFWWREYFVNLGMCSLAWDAFRFFLTFGYL